MVIALIVIAVVIALVGAWALFAGGSRLPLRNDPYDVDRQGPTTPGV